MDPVTAYEHIAEIKKAALLAPEPSDELDGTDTIIAAIGMRGALDNIIKLCRQYEKMIGKETNDARAIG
ncbi:MAG: hypothetical protein ACOCR8_00170 [Desulfosalsimonas sp.]